MAIYADFQQKYAADTKCCYMALLWHQSCSYLPMLHMNKELLCQHKLLSSGSNGSDPGRHMENFPFEYYNPSAKHIKVI